MVNAVHVVHVLVGNYNYHLIVAQLSECDLSCKHFHIGFALKSSILERVFSDLNIGSGLSQLSKGHGVPCLAFGFWFYAHFDFTTFSVLCWRSSEAQDSARKQHGKHLALGLLIYLY